MDYGIPCGTPVYATAPGSVVSAGWAGGYGNRVVLDHGYVRGVGLATTYNHLSRIVVRGGRVGRGRLIGYSGTTGMSTGCHLHFEVLVNGSFVNPQRWM
jgi:murein DD-endopeptidase MepM/ murein hydrolase activator NlpD